MSAGASAAAAAIAAGAAARSNEAMREACKASMPGFRHDTATVAEVREYADCADRLYPQEWTPETVLVAKVLVAVVLAAAIFGAVRGAAGGYGFGGRIESMVVGLLGWGAGAAGAIVIGGLMLAGIAFVVS